MLWKAEKVRLEAQLIGVTDAAERVAIRTQIAGLDNNIGKLYEVFHH